MAYISNEINSKIKKLLSILSYNGLRIERALIFGSYAKGAAGKWSDIDVALVSKDFTGIRFFDRKRINPYLIKIDARIETHPFKYEDFTKEDPFVEIILEDCVEISIDPN